MRILKYKLSNGIITTSYAVAKDDKKRIVFLEDWIQPETPQDKTKRLALIAKRQSKKSLKR